MKTTVYCRTKFEAFHRWPAAPMEVEFLRNLHRHIFHVKAEVEVAHEDRAVEFIMLQRRVNAAINDTLMRGDTTSWSCEMWASHLLQGLRLCRCEVSEDGENGAVVVR